MQELNESREEDPLFLDSVARSFHVLECFKLGSRELSNGEIQKITGYTFQTVNRITKTFEAEGYLVKNERKKTFQLSIKAIDLQFKFLSTNPIVKLVWPILVDLREKTKGRVSYCILDHCDIVYLARVAAEATDYQTSIVGRRRPALATAGGRAILSQIPTDEVQKILVASDLQAQTPHSLTDKNKILEEIQSTYKRGYAITNQETLLGELSCAVPVFGGDEKPVGAIVLSVSNDTYSVENATAQLVPLLRAAARSASL
ncbi:MAG: IclR family transcriptional regulator [Roseibium sp.]|uniref:IclR family transcriptional regulator n=1 Tax=Roseibium sp. TaxID=1936156 RepID=UPI002630BA38|nr:IclR family transcriptional regulator [Roseibium sp.]MCV0427695.1 IclR family transcriptional regulator [Roseibium sp.]